MTADVGARLSKIICFPLPVRRSYLIVELSLDSPAGLAVYVLYSRAVRLPELPRSIDLFRSAIRGR